MGRVRVELESVAWVGLLAYVGVLVRAILTALAVEADGTLLPALGAAFFLPNIFGCFTMGVFQPLATLFRAYPPLFTGVTTGFCGSCTTFATWQAFVAIQVLQGNWIDAVCQSIATFCTSLMAYTLGHHLGTELAACIVRCCDCIDEDEDEAAVPLQELAKPIGPMRAEGGMSSDSLDASTQTPPPSPPPTELKEAGRWRRVLLVGFLFAAVTGLLWYALLRDASIYRAHWWVAVAFGPVGAVSRHLLGRLNRPDLPLGTLLANLGGALVNVLLLVAENAWFTTGRYPVPRTGLEEACLHYPAYLPKLAAADVRQSFRFWALAGISGGLCGSLSTVSTWAKEIYALGSRSRWLAYRYALASVLAAQLLCIPVGGIWAAAAGRPLEPLGHPDPARCRALP